MKKMMIILLVVALLLPTVSTASDIDLSGLSFDELVALKQRVNLAIWSVEEWQEVTVPQGVYKVGIDIPAGHWTITAAEGQHTYIHWGDKLDESGIDMSYYGNIYVAEVIYSTSYRHYEKEDKTQTDYELENGQFIIIEWGQAVFSPYTGNVDLGFK